MRIIGNCRLGLFVICTSLYSLVQSQITFEKTIGGIDDDSGNDIFECSDGGFIICGQEANFYYGDTDLLLVKTDAYGEVLWTRSKSRPIHDDQYFSVIETFDNNILAGGYIHDGTKKRPYLEKLSNTGDSLWSLSLVNLTCESFSNIRQVQDSGFICAGVGLGDNKEKIYNSTCLLRLNPQGEEDWYKIYSRQTNSLELLPDGSYVCCGTYIKSSQNRDISLMKIESSGIQNWTENYGAEGDQEYGNCVKVTLDGGYIICGRLFVGTIYIGGSEMMLVKTDGDGNLLWSKYYEAGYSASGICLDITPDGGYIIAGKAQDSITDFDDIWLLRTDSEGEILWSRKYGGNYTDVPYAIKTTSDGGYIVCGKTQSFGNGGYDIYIIKTDDEGLVYVDEPEIAQSSFKVYPNPNNGRFRILSDTDFSLIEIFNLNGHCILKLEADGFAGVPYRVNLGKAYRGIIILKLTTQNSFNARTIVVH